MDGLASIVGLSTAAMLGVIAASQGHDHVAVMAMFGGLAGRAFSIYNLPPASIFLGDSGSMVIGLTVGVLGIQGALKTSATLAITAPAVVMTLPMFDIVAAVVRRRLTGRRFDFARSAPYPPSPVGSRLFAVAGLCLLGALCLTMGAAATAATIFRRDALAWIAAMTLVVLMIRLRLFGHDEFALAKQATIRTLLSCGRFFGRSAGVVQGSGFRIQGLEVEAQRSGDGTQNGTPLVKAMLNPEPRSLNPNVWDSLLGSLRAWNIRQVEFCWSLGDRRRRIRWIDPAAPIDERLPLVDLGVAAGRRRRLCELRAAAPSIPSPKEIYDALTSLLKTFGSSPPRAVRPPRRRAAFGPPVLTERGADRAWRAADDPDLPTQGGLLVDMRCPDLDIGVVYTGERELMPRLLSTMSASGEGLQMRLVLVDNASPDGVEPWLEYFPQTLVLRNDRRLCLRGQLEPHPGRLGGPLRAC